MNVFYSAENIDFESLDDYCYDCIQSIQITLGEDVFTTEGPNIDDFNIPGLVHGKGPMMNIVETGYYPPSKSCIAGELIILKPIYTIERLQLNLLGQYHSQKSFDTKHKKA